MNNEPLDERWVSIQEAAAVWGISTRAVQKRISSGSATTRKEGTRRYVLLRNYTNEPAANYERTTNPKVRTGSLAVLQAQLAMTKEALERSEAERDRWYQQTQTLTEQNSRFQIIIANLQQALPARSSAAVEEEEAPPGRGKWWQLRRR